MLKRAFDILISLLLLLALIPLLVAIAVLIKADSRGPVFHRARRVGKDGKLFTLYKFRSMVAGSAADGPGITRHGDPRVTRVGFLLRKSKVDEVPQLINVLKGEMSLVGPRPEDPRYVAHYTDEQRRVLTIRPGMVSPAALRYRYEEELLATAQDVERFYLSTVLPDKLRMDLEYVERRSFSLDLKVLCQVGVSLLTPSRSQGGSSS